MARAERARTQHGLGQLGAIVLLSVSSPIARSGTSRGGRRALDLGAAGDVETSGGDGPYLEQQPGGQSLRDRGGSPAPRAALSTGQLIPRYTAAPETD